MNHMNHEKKNLFATFALQGGCLWKHGVVRYASCLTGMALTVVLGSVLALSAPSFAQAESATPSTTPTVEKAGDGGSVISSTNIRTEITTDTTTTTVSTVEASGNITGTIEKSGVFVSHEADHDITITSEAKIKTVKHGIEAIHSGDGKLEIVNEGKIKKVEKDGIHATHSGDDLLKISSTKDIEAKNRAISALHSGVGDIEFSTDSSVDGSGEGVYAKHTGSGDLKISTEDRKNGSGGEIVASGRGISAHHEGSSGNIDIDISSGGSVTSRANDAIFIEYGDAASGSGDIALDVHGDVSGRYKGISASHNSTGDIGISAFSRVTAGNDAGIFGEHRGEGDLTISVEESGEITSSGRGVFARHGDSSGDIYIDVSPGGSVTSTGSEAIFAEQDGSGVVDIDIYGEVEGYSSGISVVRNGSVDLYRSARIKVHPGGKVSATNGDAIRASSLSDSVYVDVAGSVSSSEGNNAIDMTGGYYIQLALRPGFSLDGPVVVRTDPRYVGSWKKHYLYLYGGGSSSASPASPVLNFSEADFRGFTRFLSKSGDVVWRVTGTTKEGAEWKYADIQPRSTLRFSGVNFKMVEDTSTFTIFGPNDYNGRVGGVLEIAGRNHLRGSLSNWGRIVFVPKENQGDEDSSLTISGRYRGITGITNIDGTSRGYPRELVFNVDLARQSAGKLTVEGDSTVQPYPSPTSVSMLVPEPPSGNSPPEGERTSPVLIEVKGSARATDFEGSSNVGVHNYALEHDDVSGVHEWRFVYKGPSSSATAGNSTTTILTGLVGGVSVIPRPRRESSDLSFRDDVSEYAGGIWAQRQSSSLLLEPSGIAGSHLRMEDNRVRFGFDLPSTNMMGGDVDMGVSMWQGLSNSDISSPTGNGVIGVESHAAVLTASWRSPNGFYADGWTQYVRFSSDVSAGGVSLVRGNEGTGVSLSAEAGYRFAVPLGGMDFQVSPQMELFWSRIGFDDFAGPQGELISLEDGDLVKGRLGLSWDGEWRDARGSGRVYSGISLLNALDGKTAVNISGFSLASEQRGLSVDGRVGVLYEWNKGYAVRGEAMALRRDEVEELRADLGVRIEF